MFKKGTNKGLGNLLTDSITDLEFKLGIGQNVSIFSAFKVHTHYKSLAALLYDADGNPVPFSKFKKEALKISNHQNVNWLKTEYNTAIRRANLGAKFKQFEADKAIYPNLKWLPTRSTNPDPTHKALWGVVYPINHPFWASNFPGNRYNCLCGIEQTTEPVNEAPEGYRPEKVKGLEKNPAKTNEVFNPTHDFFNVSTKESSLVKKAFDDYAFKQSYGRAIKTYKNGSKIYVHPFTDVSDFAENMRAAQLLADFEKIIIKLRPHAISSNYKTGIGLSKQRQPEYLINGLFGDLKEVEGLNIDGGWKKAVKQDCKIVVFHIKSELTVNRVFEQIKGKLNLLKNPEDGFKEIYVIKKDKVYKYKKEK